MTSEKLQKGNNLDIKISSIEKTLRTIKKARSKIINKEDDYYVPTPTEATVICSIGIESGVDLNQERLLEFLKDEIKIVSELLNKTKEEFNKL